MRLRIASIRESMVLKSLLQRAVVQAMSSTRLDPRLECLRLRPLLVSGGGHIDMLDMMLLISKRLSHAVFQKLMCAR